MNFKIEKNGPNVVMISLDNKTCLLTNETIKELQNMGTGGPFRDKLIAEVKTHNSGMAESLKNSLSNPEKIFEIMGKVKAFALQE